MKKKNIRLIVFIAVILLIFIVVILLNFSGFVTSIDSNEKPIITLRILDFESPVELGNFMNFKYHMRGVTGINDVVNINFKIEKNEEIISSGSDIIYIGDIPNRTITTKIFLPSDLESGIYKFKIGADYKNYSIGSYRIIEIEVKDKSALIFSSNGGDLKIYIILLLILSAFLIMALIYQLERKKINEALIKEKKFIKKYRLSILTLSLFLILGILIYYLKLINVLLGIPIYFYYSFLGILVLLILININSKKRKKKRT